MTGRSFSSRCGSDASGKRNPAGRIARHELHASGARRPLFGTPAPLIGGVPALHRQHVGRRRVETAPERSREPRAFFRIVEFGVERRDVLRQRGFFIDQRLCVFVGRRDERGIDVDAARDATRERSGVFVRRTNVLLFARDVIGVAPQRHPVAAPIERKGPARQGFAGIPFAPDRSGACRPERTDRVSGESRCRRSRVWLDPRRPSSTLRHPCRRSRRTSVRRPS